MHRGALCKVFTPMKVHAEKNWGHLVFSVNYPIPRVTVLFPIYTPCSFSEFYWKILEFI